MKKEGRKGGGDLAGGLRFANFLSLLLDFSQIIAGRKKIVFCVFRSLASLAKTEDR